MPQSSGDRLFRRPRSLASRPGPRVRVRSPENRPHGHRPFVRSIRRAPGHRRERTRAWGSPSPLYRRAASGELGEQLTRVAIASAARHARRADDPTGGRCCRCGPRRRLAYRHQPGSCSTSANWRRGAANSQRWRLRRMWIVAGMAPPQERQARIGTASRPRI